MKPDIITTINGQGVQLRQMGRDYWGLCPFHEERTPSFKVSAARQIFHCFGCGAHGDVIDFIQKRRGVNFKEALVVLGITASRPPEPDPAQERRRNLLSAFRRWQREYYRALADQSIFLHQLRLAAKRNPAIEEGIAWHYAKTISALPAINHKLDILLYGPDELRFQLFREVHHV